MNRDIILFYKRLTEVGGAERLLAQEFQHLRNLGLNPYLATSSLTELALFDLQIPADRLIVFDNDRPAFVGLASTIRSLGRPPVLCSSGHIDTYLACKLASSSYALHLHHPNFMSFNDYDKFSVFLRKHLRHYSSSNFGANRFLDIDRGLSLADHVLLNARALLSIRAIRGARCTFVLSEYARKEKRSLYGVESEVLCGALPDSFEEQLKASVAAREQSAGQLRLCTLARLDPNKRIDEVIRAVRLLVDSQVSVHLTIAGEGPQKRALLSLTEDLCLQNHVTFLGYVPDAAISDLFAGSDFFVSIDWADYKLTMFEALAHGVPCVVSTETECPSELLQSHFVRAISPTADALAETLSLGKPAMPADMSPLASVLRRYTWTSYFDSIRHSLDKAGLWDHLHEKPQS
jgi:glycosyltransferase involved in cell wall biosynthesis